MDKFTKEWNLDERNRDKTIAVFNQLSDAKEDMQDSLKLMLERDGKIEESLARGQNLKVVSSSYKKSSNSLNRNLKWRLYCYWITIILIVIIFVILLILWISGKL